MWRVSLTVAETEATAFAELLESVSISVSRFETTSTGLWVIEAICDRRPDRHGLQCQTALLAAARGLASPVITVTRLQELDWVAHVNKIAQPIHVRRFIIRSQQHTRIGAKDIVADAGLAFGTGEHASTRGCLTAIDLIARRYRPRRILDLGCGTGILAIACAKTCPARVLAADVDPVAANTARENARINAVCLRVVVSTGFSNRLVRSMAPYDLIVANILARPLICLAGDFSRHLSPGGIAVISGLLRRQERAVIHAYSCRGFVLKHRTAIDEWHTLVFVKPFR